MYPFFFTLRVDLTVARRFCGTTLGNEYGDALLDSVLHAVTQIVTMGGSIEMNGVHDILKTSQWTLCHEVDILIPVGTAYQYDIVRVVLADLANHLCSVFLQVSPGVLHRLVVYLIDDMGILAVFLCHLAKELLRLSGLHVVAMPVDDDIHIILDGGLDDIGHTLLGKGGILQVVVLNHNTHCRTDNTGVPVFFQRFDSLFVIETRPDVMPSETDTTEDNGSPILVTQL